MVRGFRIERFGSIDGIVAMQEPEPAPGPGQVLVRLHARALNRRDQQDSARTSWSTGSHIHTGRRRFRRKLTAEQNHVVETGGLDTLARSIASCAPDGHIALAAALGAGQVDARVLAAPVTIRRFYVGSRIGLELMSAAIAANRLRPVIDSTFALDEARGAHRRLESGQAIEKVVIAG